MVLGPYVAQIPMAALVAVMIMVSINTFQWRSLGTLVTNPKTSSVVMLGTVAVVVATHDLAKGVLFGVILSGLFFAHKVTKFFAVRSARGEDDVRTYTVSGQIFFATAEAFHAAFDFREEALKGVVIDLQAAHFWDISAINALDRVVLKFRASRGHGRRGRDERGDGHDGRARRHPRQAGGDLLRRWTLTLTFGYPRASSRDSEGLRVCGSPFRTAINLCPTLTRSNRTNAHRCLATFEPPARHRVPGMPLDRPCERRRSNWHVADRGPSGQGPDRALRTGECPTVRLHRMGEQAARRERAASQGSGKP